MKLKIQTPTGKVTKATIKLALEAIELDRQISDLQTKAKAVKLQLKEGIEAQDLQSIKTEEFSIIYKGATARNSIDTKALKEQEPKIYKKYLKISQVASSIAVK